MILNWKKLAFVLLIVVPLFFSALQIPNKALAEDEIGLRWSPLESEVVGTIFYVHASISAPVPEQYTATLEVEGRSFPLKNWKWEWLIYDTVSLAGMERGEKKITFKLTFHSGKVLKETRTVFYEPSPTIEFDTRAQMASEENGKATIKLVRKGNVSERSVLCYYTVDRSAISYKDYVPGEDHERVVIFRPGETSKTIEIKLINDHKTEPLETFGIKLYRPDGHVTAIGEKSETTVVIRDAD
ncbi:hypothetical protein GK047_03600 [Paenibacillus sp. SYP-B3998]|uniref:Calx-beta domain-containing protein n=1 Tax=Paenibacillus sp. SYP-B3998 TaxID=2678564 RepID=A0A6G3ZSK8_9BACL|nr:Calx-beta domain-containing protein [Paenibacillus sp. SYP-B3998]NEW05105.1 hypothetical protein [Paenibacillus sp. SYP-B3998]